MKKWLTLSNILYTASILFALFVMVKTYFDRRNLPEGVCPFDNNRQLMFVAIGFLITVMIITTMMDRRKRLGEGKKHMDQK